MLDWRMWSTLRQVPHSASPKKSPPDMILYEFPRFTCFHMFTQIYTCCHMFSCFTVCAICIFFVSTYFYLCYMFYLFQSVVYAAPSFDQWKKEHITGNEFRCIQLCKDFFADRNALYQVSSSWLRSSSCGTLEPKQHPHRHPHCYTQLKH